MSKSKVVVLTLELGGNYGGMMQAYALQKSLRNLGLDVYTTHIREFGVPEKLLRLGYYTVKRLLHQVRPSAATLTPDLNRHRYARTQRFIDRYIQQMDGGGFYRAKSKGDIDAIVVGSDQVWRKQYVSIPTYLLDFTDGWDVTRISYAASFGRDDLANFNQGLIEKSAKLAKRFDAISVREDSAVELVEKQWGLDSMHHVDPTMLLDAEHYRGLLNDNAPDIKKSEGNLFAYVLDNHEPKGGIIKKISDGLGLTPFNILPPTAHSRKEFFANLPKYQLPPTPQWLQSFEDSEFVITDSFHGTVFAILFHKPFVVVGNARRGMARFTSLLKMFGLEERLVAAVDDVTDELLAKGIDWHTVDARIEEQRQRSTDYLKEYLL